MVGIGFGVRRLREYHQSMAKEAVEKNWTQLDFLNRLVEGETLRRKDRATKRRIQAARFPIIKTLEQFNWTWPKKINRAQVQNLFRLSFLKVPGKQLPRAQQQRIVAESLRGALAKRLFVEIVWEQ